jgi:spoIIIJ-associated protein
VKDRLFSGTDVEDALSAAAASLGLPRAELRYVVLEAGGGGGRGLSPTPARIAVLIQDPRPSTRASGDREDWGGREGRAPADAPREPERADVHGGVRAVVRALAEAGGLALECETEDTESTFVVQLLGEGCPFFFGEDGKGEPLRALEHLLQRAYGESLRPRVLRVRCEGFRERRDLAISEEARALAAEVRRSGEPRTLEPMNSYERRIVHLALQDETDVRTFSVGEGAERRVTIERAEPGPVAAEGGDADGR